MQLNSETKKYTELTLLTLLNAPILYITGSWAVHSLYTAFTTPKAQIDDMGRHDMFVTDAIGNTVIFVLVLTVFILALVNRKWARYLNFGLCAVVYGILLYTFILK